MGQMASIQTNLHKFYIAAGAIDWLGQLLLIIVGVLDMFVDCNALPEILLIHCRGQRVILPGV